MLKGTAIFYKNTVGILTVFCNDSSKQRVNLSVESIKYMSSPDSADAAGFGHKKMKSIWVKMSPYQRLQHHMSILSMEHGAKPDSFTLELLSNV